MKKLSLSLLSAGACVALTINCNAAVVLTESFTYPNGVLVGAVGSPWAAHSGTGAVDVVSGAAFLTGADGEDVNAPLSGSPYSSLVVLTATFDVNFSILPAGAGTYFAHFKDATTSGFRARAFASVVDAAPGLFRLGLSNGGSTTTTYLTLDLSLGTTYQVALTWNTNTNQSSISVNSGSPVVATDATTSLPITTFALRQSTASGASMGALALDNLQVNTTVIPEPASVAFGLLGMVAMFRRRR